MRLFSIAVLLFPAITAASEPPDYRQASRDLVATFATELKGELTAAMSESGPDGAIRVCRDLAPEIAARLSRQSGANIGRTSLRFRNPQNVPEPWQYPRLVQFDQLGADARREELETLETAPAPGVAARYMKAIPVQPPCLACHGEPAGEVREALARAYPHDRATGYALGDIRGAFYVVWPEPPDGMELD